MKQNRRGRGEEPRGGRWEMERAAGRGRERWLMEKAREISGNQGLSSFTKLGLQLSNFKLYQVALPFSKRTSTTASVHPNVEPNTHLPELSLTLDFNQHQKPKTLEFLCFEMKQNRRGASWGKMGDGESGGERERAVVDGESERGVRLQTCSQRL
ncbi:hypothetical protein Drorol1_Dr00025956 [Drosera rotundifolia]